jgi:hypothetical protein
MQTLVLDPSSRLLAVLPSGFGEAADHDPPELDRHGLLRYHGAWVAVSPGEERVLRPLLRSWQACVSRQQLAAEVWPDDRTNLPALNSIVHRLRRRLRPLGLTVASVRARGLILRPQPDTHPNPIAGVTGSQLEGTSWLIS